MSISYRSLATALSGIALTATISTGCVIELNSLSAKVASAIPYEDRFIRYDTQMGKIHAKKGSIEGLPYLQLVLEPIPNKDRAGFGITDYGLDGLDRGDGVIRLESHFDPRIAYHPVDYDPEKHANINVLYHQMLRIVSRTQESPRPKSVADRFIENSRRDSDELLISKLRQNKK